MPAENPSDYYDLRTFVNALAPSPSKLRSKCGHLPVSHYEFAFKSRFNQLGVLGSLPASHRGVGFSAGDELLAQVWDTQLSRSTDIDRK